MKAYVGQGRITKGCKKARVLREAGLGLCLCPGELPPLHEPWFFDNGAFRAWRAGEAFDEGSFVEALLDIERDGLRPDFFVVPDMVAEGLDSLAFSLWWRGGLAGRWGPLYLAVQDGMRPEDVAPHAEGFGGIFVGGTVPWKMRTGVEWVDFAHERGMPCHVGRVGTAARVEWARAIGVDSIDSSLPLWSREKLEGFLGALRSEQVRMWP